MTDEYSVSKSFITALANLTHRFLHPPQNKKIGIAGCIPNYADIFPGLKIPKTHLQKEVFYVFLKLFNHYHAHKARTTMYS